MHIPIILDQGVSLVAFFVITIARLGTQRASTIRPRVPERDNVVPETPASIPLDRLPDAASLAGTPLRILLSDRSGPGAVLRDTLMIRPSTRDP
jgi:hypothetical protein